MTPDITLSTTFARAVDGGYPQGFIYARSGNPNRRALEHCIADLEGGTACAAFSSGSAATYAVLQALAPGDHVILPSDVYHGTRMQLRDLLAHWGPALQFRGSHQRRYFARRADAPRPGWCGWRRPRIPC